jgi:hypothetical protein
MTPWSTINSKKFLVRFGIGFGAAFVLFGAFVLVEYSWLTAGERQAAQSALAAIDGFQRFDTANDDDFVAKVQDVQAAVDNARRSAATFRDQQVAFSLLRYLGSIEIEQETARTNKVAQDWIEASEIRDLSPAETMRLTDLTGRLLSLKLHQELD